MTRRDILFFLFGIAVLLSVSATDYRTAVVDKNRETALKIQDAFDISYEMAEHFVFAGERTSIDPILLASLAKTESEFNLKAVSPKGYKSIMQTKPATMKHADVDILHGARELELWLKMKKGDTYKAIACYKGGTKPPKVAYRQAKAVLALYDSVK